MFQIKLNNSTNEKRLSTSIKSFNRISSKRKIIYYNYNTNTREKLMIEFKSERFLMSNIYNLGE